MTCNDQLITALESMDVLNRWARMSGVSRPRKAIYWLKSRYAVRDAIMAGLTTRMRVVAATVKCNRCINGVYYTWDGAPRGTCHLCNGSTHVTLKFVELTIDGWWTWHFPTTCSSWLGWPIQDLNPEPVVDWAPGRAGIDLDIEEACRHLNVVESHWSQWIKEQPYEHSFDEHDGTRYFLFNYVLPLPAPAPNTCFRCGSIATRKLCCIHPACFESITCACEDCATLPKVWDHIRAESRPEIGEHAAAWAKRHSVVFADYWKSRGFAFNDEWPVQRVRPLCKSQS